MSIGGHNIRYNVIAILSIKTAFVLLNFLRFGLGIALIVYPCPPTEMSPLLQQELTVIRKSIPVPNECFTYLTKDCVIKELNKSEVPAIATEPRQRENNFLNTEDN